MKTLSRVALALMTLVGPMSLADTRPSDARPADAVESAMARKAPAAESDRPVVGPKQSDLEARIRDLEADIARLEEKEQQRYQFPGAWNINTDGP
jgi:TolA-binding protein